MSHQALARVVMRLLHDPQADVSAADLSAEERAWLSEVDPRAWSVDHERPARVLKGLVDELPASVAIATARASYPAVLAFFRSTWFHAEVDHRGSLIEGFAEHLRELGADPGVLGIELAQARARRPSSGRGLCCAPGVAAVTVDGSALENLNRIERLLFELSLFPAMALSRERPGLPELAPPAGTLHLVVTPEGLRQLGRVVCEVLQRLPTDNLAGVVTELGLPSHVAESLEADLLRHGLAVIR